MFSVGHGATLNTDGKVELDALIMEGKTLASGAVSSVKNIANPVSLARAVMEKVFYISSYSDLVLLMISFCGIVFINNSYIFSCFYISSLMLQTSHVMLTDTGANLFAESIGFKTVPTDELVGQYELKEWKAHKNYGSEVVKDYNFQWYVSPLLDSMFSFLIFTFHSGIS